MRKMTISRSAIFITFLNFFCVIGYAFIKTAFPEETVKINLLLTGSMLLCLLTGVLYFQDWKRYQKEKNKIK